MDGWMNGVISADTWGIVGLVVCFGHAECVAANEIGIIMDKCFYWYTRNTIYIKNSRRIGIRDKIRKKNRI